MGDLYHLLLINIIQIPKLRSKIENARTLFYFRVIIYLPFTIRVKITLLKNAKRAHSVPLLFGVMNRRSYLAFSQKTSYAPMTSSSPVFSSPVRMSATWREPRTSQIDIGIRCSCSLKLHTASSLSPLSCCRQ